MNKLKSLLLVSALLLSAALASASDAAGVWAFDFESRKGQTVHATIELSVQGDQVTGTFEGPKGSHPISNGKISGETVSFQVTREARRGQLTANYSGKVTGDTLTGTVTVTGPRGKTVTRPWTAKRVTTG